jgi:pyruvate-ferredoxin/flavodoxin oxidoreductase
LKKGGSFLLNSIWDEEETKNRLPDHMKKYLAQNEINFYIINGTKLGEEIGLGSRTNTIMQSAFFKITGVIPFDLAVQEMKDAIVKSYGKMGEKVIHMNYAAVDAGGKNVHKVAVPAEWKNIEVSHTNGTSERPDYIVKVVDVINNQKGDSLAGIHFHRFRRRYFPNGYCSLRKTWYCSNVPEWQAENCIQCNQCAYICPHAAIRPFLLTDEEVAGAPEGTETRVATPSKMYNGMSFRIQVSVLDCTGCGNCVEVCPSKEKALVMDTLDNQRKEIERWDYMAKKYR